MQCPKCNGGSFLLDEELVKHIEGQEPQRIIIRAKRKCLSCQEEFSRLVWDDLGPHRRHQPAHPGYPQQPQQYQQAPNPYQYQQQPAQQKEEEVVDGLKFF